MVLYEIVINAQGPHKFYVVADGIITASKLAIDRFNKKSPGFSVSGKNVVRTKRICSEEALIIEGCDK